MDLKKANILQIVLGLLAGSLMTLSIVFLYQKNEQLIDRNTFNQSNEGESAIKNNFLLKKRRKNQMKMLVKK